MLPIKFGGRVSDTGSLILADTDGFKQHVLQYAGKEIDLIVKKASHDKTQQQLGYFFGAVIPSLCEVTGYSTDEMYGIAKKMYLTRNPDTEKEYVASLSQLNREEVSQFIDQCVNLAWDLGANCPPANRVHVEE